MSNFATFQTLRTRQDTGCLWSGDKLGVVVFGAGSSGISALAELQRRQLPALVLESRLEIGGIWSQSAHRATYPHLLQNTAPALTVFAESAAQMSASEHLTRQQYADYLLHYTQQQQLTEYIYTGCTLLSVHQDQQGLELVVQNSAAPEQQMVIRAAHLINASGLYHQPQMPELPGLDSFTGILWHSSDVDYAVLQQLRHVLVLGGGNTAVDMAVAAHQAGNRVSMSYRSATWILPRMVDGVPLDVLYQQLCQQYGALLGQPRFRERCLAAGAWYSAGASTETALDFTTARISVSTDVLPLLQQQVVMTYPAVSHIKEGRVFFTDGRSMQPDCIVCCTGYSYQSPSLPANVDSPQPLIGEVRHPQLPQYWCLGAPAVWGGSPPVAQAQARLAATAIAAGWSVEALEQRVRHAPAYQRTAQSVGPGFAVVEYQGYLDFVAAICGDTSSHHVAPKAAEPEASRTQAAAGALRSADYV